MFSSTQRRLTAGAAALAGALTLGLGTFGSTAASAQQLTLVRCTGGGFTMDVNASAIGSGTLSDCRAPGHPELTSAVISMTGLPTVSDDIVETTTSDKITWNTGAVTRLTEARTFVPTLGNRVREAGEGATVSGLFHPSDETELGRGTQTFNHAHHFVINNGFTLALADGALG
ncbi:hypothetical protein [Streptomyces hiroshimensis]|uniref:Uncharacterized protein n=1 Tax=Streptomyces hiroshimensis TaxID=66424 RepID=A0ABQ2Y7B5_9ACTN|nr:hypothetical protein [Streptomyces hiroshimensis]GGX71435.1 hypothetical protein GCM10010324_15740 [Streptomyces hiroshimensis]